MYTIDTREVASISSQDKAPTSLVYCLYTLQTKMKRLTRLLAIIAVLLMWMYAGTYVNGYEAVQEVSQRERVLTETKYAIKETYLAWQADEYGSKKQLFRLIKQYNDCKRGNEC